MRAYFSGNILTFFNNMPFLLLLRFTTSQWYTSKLNRFNSTPTLWEYLIVLVKCQLRCFHASESSKCLLEYSDAVTTYHQQMVSSSSIICGNFTWGFCGLSVAPSSVAIKCLLLLQFALIALRKRMVCFVRAAFSLVGSCA